jgi:hypothetical protein
VKLGASGRVQDRRRAAPSPGRRRAAGTPVAQVRLTMLPAAHVGWPNALRATRSPAARSGASSSPAVNRRDRRRADGVRAGRKAAWHDRRGADAQRARPWRRCAGRKLPDGRVGWHNALRIARRHRPVPPPTTRCPSPRPPRADGDARRGGRRVHHLRGVGRRMAHHPETSASGHFAGTPARGLRARGAGAPGDTSGCPGWAASRASRLRCRRPVPAPAAPRSVAATAGVRVGRNVRCRIMSYRRGCLELALPS